MTHIMSKIFPQSFTVPRHSFVWFVLEFNERFWTSLHPRFHILALLTVHIILTVFIGPSYYFPVSPQMLYGVRALAGPLAPNTNHFWLHSQLADHHLPVFYWFHLIRLMFLSAWALPDMVLEVLHTRLHFGLVRLQNIKGKLSALVTRNTGLRRGSQGEKSKGQ